MSECKYCHSEANGDVPIDRKYLFDRTVMKSVRKYGAKQKLVGFIMQNRLAVSIEAHSEDFSVDLFTEYFEFNYCPMCGRKLEAFTDD